MTCNRIEAFLRHLLGPMSGAQITLLRVAVVLSTLALIATLRGWLRNLRRKGALRVCRACDGVRDRLRNGVPRSPSELVAETLTRPCDSLRIDGSKARRIDMGLGHRDPHSRADNLQHLSSRDRNT